MLSGNTLLTNKKLIKAIALTISSSQLADPLSCSGGQCGRMEKFLVLV